MMQERTENEPIAQQDAQSHLKYFFVATKISNLDLMVSRRLLATSDVIRTINTGMTSTPQLVTQTTHHITASHVKNRTTESLRTFFTVQASISARSVGSGGIW